MPSLAHIIRMRKRQRQASHRNPGGKLGLGCSLIASLLVVMLGVLLVFIYTETTRALPSIETLPALLEPPNGRYLQPTRLYDRSGEHLILVLQHPAAADWQYLDVAASIQNDNPYQHLIAASLAAADPGFWQHPGVSISSLAQREPSTLAQRLAVDILLNQEPSGLQRTLRAHLLAIQMTSRFGREKVLEWYLNSANYGRLAYGADAAARLYFGKQAEDLNLAEAAMLAAAAAAPDLNPMDAPQAAIEKQRLVIQDMLRYRFVTPEQGIEAIREGLTFRDTTRQGQALQISELSPAVAPAFTKLALTQLKTQFKRSELERGGLRIITTLDYDLQLQATCATQRQLARLGVETPQTLGVNLPDSCEAARLLPTEDTIETAFTGLSADIVVLDPQTGQILALLGDPPAGPQTPALHDHPTGSLLTPYIYLTAFTRGLSPASLVWDIPMPESDGAIQNFDNQYHGPMRLRIALANDYLVPAQKTLYLVGPENTLRTIKQFNLAFQEAATTSQDSALDFIAETNLVNASQAFGVFANQGLLAGVSLEEPGEQRSLPPLEPVTILRVERSDGEILLHRETSQTRPIITPQLAYVMNHALSDESARWPSLGHPNPLEIGRPAAAKLSQSLSGNSQWAVGYTPELVVGAWIGSADLQVAQSEEQNLALQNAAAGLWHAVIQYASQPLPATVWEAPEGISFIEVCDPSGLLPTASCPNVVREVFLPGSEPVQEDRLYRLFQIDSETGRLATVFTPPDRIEERVYMIVPDEAQSWARDKGLAVPPTFYDTLPIQLASSAETNISQPTMFAIVRGETPIAGQAGGEAFAFYRLQVGEGLNPQAWMQIGQDVNQPTRGQFLLWDTRGLNGLYTIQLLVVRKDQNVERRNVLVTVDNLPPEVEIVAPVNGAQISPVHEQDIILRVQASDEMGIQSLAFYLDERLLATLSYPPFAISWSPKSGEHSLRVIATDQAGNTNEASVTFTVSEP